MEHEHTWVKSPLMASVQTLYDGPAFRYVPLEMCKDCGVLRAAAVLAGYETWDEFESRAKPDVQSGKKGKEVSANS